METTTTDVTPVKTRCAECCVRCLGGVPYASLVATLLCFAGVALFCGCGHEALGNALALLDDHFQYPHHDSLLLFQVVDVVRFCMYGTVAAFLLLGILLFTEGFFTTGAVQGRHGDFKTTACGRCISAMFIGLTYLLTLLWLGVLGLAALPVFLTLNIRASCHAALTTSTTSTTSTTAAAAAGSSSPTVCVDLRQYGILPWNHSTAVLCDRALENMCNTQEFILAHHLFIVAYAGAAATVIAMIHYLMVLTANWGYVKTFAASASSPGPAAASCGGGGGAQQAPLGAGDAEMGDLHNGKGLAATSQDP
ncbi:neuronal membrane glycoprotein M6-b-like isoform X2 [Lethenteron reissneri]|uniref:neuronal membrane glycoprotein M6-b-like isoform X2 n=1 Tax=Lethenteron reissneri TaxID=7753 RepID=UPI002AB7AEA4|nr:neuronal membrane glycoprotein M6-b-like isoform X2 [Lethenteron reissneri]